MKKTLKIFIKTVLIFVGVVMLAIISVPTLFRGTIENAAKKIINENVNAHVDFNNLSISLLKDFPNAKISLENLVVVGVDAFENDTIAMFKSFSVSVNLWSLMKGNYVVNSIIVDDLYLDAHMLADGSANWNIMKESTSDVETPAEEETSESNFKLKLKKFDVNNANIIYNNELDKTIASIKNLNLKLKGDLSSTQTLINLSTDTEGVSLYSDGKALLSNLPLALDGEFDADLANNIFTLKENEIRVNKMALTADGVVKIIGEGMDFDLNYGLKVQSLKSLLGLIPPTIMEEVNDIETKGDLSMNGSIKGLYSEKSMPVIILAMKIQDGYLKYAGFSESIKDINLDLDMLLDANKDANSYINLNKFNLNVINNPLSLSGNVTYPFTDPNMNFTANGRIDFTSLRKSLPIVSTSLHGVLDANITFAGIMSQIEKKQFDKIKLAGNLNLESFKMKMESITPEILIDKASLTFNPASCSLNSFDAKMGKSDLQLTGKLENMLPYVFQGGLLKGNLNLKSSLLDCNELMDIGGGETETTTAEISESGVLVLPGNVDFNINASVKKMVFDNLAMENFAGGLTLKEGKLNINKISTYTLGGLMNLSGSYFAKDDKKANVAMVFSMNDVKVDDIANTFGIFGKFAPMLKNMKGKANFSLDFNSEMDENMNLNYKTLNATGTFKTNDIAFLNSENLAKFTSLLKMDTVKSIKNVNLNYAIKNGKINVNPFDVKLGDINMKIGGEHGIDNDLNYDADVDLPAGKIGSEINNTLSKLGIGASGAASKVKVGVKIKGSMTNPSFSLGLPKYGGGSGDASVTDGVVSSVKETAQAAIDTVKNQVKEKANEIIDSAKNKAAEKVTNKLKDLLKR